MHDYTQEMSELTKKIFLGENKDAILKIDKIEEKVDEMRSKMMNDHIARLNSGECKAESSSIFINLVSNIERLADHITYIAHS